MMMVALTHREDILFSKIRVLEEEIKNLNSIIESQKKIITHAVDVKEQYRETAEKHRLHVEKLQELLHPANTQWVSHV